ncbi:MAG: phosphoglucosamine mutase [Chloroflexi bacterium]|nr:phosphoglucosamine mutase [Chloroflexota bacterium]
MQTVKYFGTDGIRGTYGAHPMTEEFMTRLGFAVGTVLGHDADAISEQPIVMIGRDTRESGPALQEALSRGLTATGAIVWDLGILPTPGVAFLTQAHQASAGAVISASHNPAKQNGIKFFSSEGTKLSLEQELEIEAILEATQLEDIAPMDESKVFDRMDLQADYLRGLLASQRGLKLNGKRVLVDCSNGAAYRLAPRVLDILGAEVLPINTMSEGNMINVNAGSERARSNPAELAAIMKEKGAELAVAFDGDADRVIFLDELGRLIDGDHILAILADYLHAKDLLLGDTLVTTVMANGALKKYAQRQGFKLKTTPVGDKYVTEALQEIQDETDDIKKIGLGGEQSGHIILLDQTHQTGDGLRTMLFVLAVVMHSDEKSLAILADRIQKYPQLVASCDVATKIPLNEIKALNARFETLGEDLPGLVEMNSRYSGTENKYRLMLEADTRHTAHDLAKIAWEICDLVQAETGSPAGSKIEVLNVADGGLIPRL